MTFFCPPNLAPQDFTTIVEDGLFFLSSLVTFLLLSPGSDLSLSVSPHSPVSPSLCCSPSSSHMAFLSITTHCLFCTFYFLCPNCLSHNYFCLGNFYMNVRSRLKCQFFKEIVLGSTILKCPWLLFLIVFSSFLSFDLLQCVCSLIYFIYNFICVMISTICLLCQDIYHKSRGVVCSVHQSPRTECDIIIDARQDFPAGPVFKNLPANAEDTGFDPWSGN